jgi:GTP cyclohydrolase II
MEYRIENCSINTVYGDFKFYCFNFGDHEDENVLCLVDRKNSDSIPLLRIQSACFTAEIFRSTDCDCHEQLVESLNGIHEYNNGLLIYLLRDGRGAGIFNKVKGLKLGEDKKLDTADAYDYLGINRDPRKYLNVVEILKYFSINEVKLLTNNPRKISGLTEQGIKVEHVPLIINPTEKSYNYLKTKNDKMGHMLGL